jgi:Cu/Ag efflux protein CusF
MKRRIWMGSAILVISLAFVTGMMAQPNQVLAQTTQAKELNWEKVSGTIEKVDKTKKEVHVTSDRGNMVFTLGKKTIVSQDGYKFPIAGLKKGTKVLVEYEKKDNKMIAEWISVEKMMKAKPGAPSKKIAEK